ncbi:hypothetical protein AB0I81_22785 [Nonomuraea sp. NPDC050404]|uniref:hypothetical protein n=1 Tax=Nonomuraea sp. NPDC050404 TaxID=3155783 RepID=UPI0033D6AB80
MKVSDLTGAHWEALRTQALLGGWVEARQRGISVGDCDAIADAAFAAVRERIELWASQVDEGKAS